MKKKNLLLLFCSIFIIKCINADQQCSSAADEQEYFDTDGFDEEELFEWEEDDDVFLDSVAGGVEHTEKDKHEISLFNKAFIGAKVIWSFCVLLPYQTAKHTYFNYVHPFVVYPFKYKKKHKKKKRKTYVA